MKCQKVWEIRHFFFVSSCINHMKRNVCKLLSIQYFDYTHIVTCALRTRTTNIQSTKTEASNASAFNNEVVLQYL